MIQLLLCDLSALQGFGAAVFSERDGAGSDLRCFFSTCSIDIEHDDPGRATVTMNSDAHSACAPLALGNYPVMPQKGEVP